MALFFSIQNISKATWTKLLLSVSYRVILSVLAPFGLFLVTAFVHYMEEEEEELYVHVVWFIRDTT